MKKTLLLITVILLISNYTIAQSYTISTDETIEDDTIRISGDATASEISFEVIFHNNANNGANIKVLRNEVIMTEGSSSYFHWVATYNYLTDLSGQQYFVPAGGSCPQGTFVGYYTPNDVVGVSIIEYTFFNIDNEAENVKAIVEFNTIPEGIGENLLKGISVSEIYPNPATSFVNVDYDIPVEVDEASVKIVNILGSVVKEQQINTGENKMRMNISELNGGIYFYSIIINGEIYSTKKLVIR